MLTAEDVKGINLMLGRGEVTPVVELLSGQVDLRAKELPAIDKPVLAKVGKILANGPDAARVLGEAALHPNVSVRRFVRKLVMSLKAESAPLAPFVRDSLQRYLTETTALDYSEKPREAALRREQADVLATAFEVLRRADMAVFLEYAGTLMEHWHAVSLAQKAAAAPGQAAGKGRGEALRAAWKTTEERTQALFEVNYGQLGFKLHELAKASPRLWAELQTKLQEDPEARAARAQADAVMAAVQVEVASNPVTAPIQNGTLMEHYYNVTQALSDVLLLNYDAGPGKVASTDQLQISETYWSWMERGLLESSLPLWARVESFGAVRGHMYVEGRMLQERAIPALQNAKAAGLEATTQYNDFVAFLNHSLWPRHEHNRVSSLPDFLAPAAITALKNGTNMTDRILDRLAGVAAEEWKKRGQIPPATPEGMEIPVTAQTPTDTPPAALPESSPAPIPSLLQSLAGLTGALRTAGTENADADDPVAGAAARFVTTAERVAALRQPPIIRRKKYFEFREEPLEPTELLASWRKMPDWDEAAFASVAHAPLMDELHLRLEHLAKALAKQQPEKELPPEAAAALNTDEIQKWRDKELDREKMKAEGETDEVIYVLRGLGGLPVAVEILHLLAATELTSYHRRHVYGAPALLERRATFTEADAEAARTLLEMSEAQNKPDRSAQELEWDRKNHAGWLAVALYKSPTAKHRIEAIQVAGGAGAYHADLARLARERADFAFLLPLTRALMPYSDNQSPDLQGLWMDMLAADTAGAMALVPALLSLLAAATDAKRTKLVLEMLDCLDKKVPWPAETFPVLQSCLESPLPPVNKLALERLAQFLKLEEDWEALIELAGEKQFSENAGVAKEAARFLGQAGAERADLRHRAEAALGEALEVQNLPLQEAALKAFAALVKGSGRPLGPDSMERVRQLRAAQADRLGKLCDKLVQ